MRGIEEMDARVSPSPQNQTKNSSNKQKSVSHCSNDNTKPVKKIKKSGKQSPQRKSPYVRKTLQDLDYISKDNLNKNTEDQNFSKLIGQNFTFEDFTNFQTTLNIAYDKIQKLNQEKKTLMDIVSKLFSMLKKTGQYQNVNFSLSNQTGPKFDEVKLSRHLRIGIFRKYPQSLQNQNSKEEDRKIEEFEAKDKQVEEETTRCEKPSFEQFRKIRKRRL